MSLKASEQKLSRSDIVSAAAHLIAEQGLESLTMRNIAKHVGCSVGTLPHYFDGKDDIVIAALNWSNERIMVPLGNLPSTDVHLDNLYPLLSSAMPINDISDTEWRVRLCLWDYAVTNDEMRETVNAIANSAIQLLEILVDQLQKGGDIKPNYNAKITATTIYHMCIGASFNMLHSPLDERESQLQPLYTYIESIKA